jgi:hypothetical protein
MTQNWHKRRRDNHISHCQDNRNPKSDHSIGNGEVDSSILSGSTIHIISKKPLLAA